MELLVLVLLVRVARENEEDDVDGGDGTHHDENEKRAGERSHSIRKTFAAGGWWLVATCNMNERSLRRNERLEGEHHR